MYQDAREECVGVDWLESDEYADYEQDNQPSWHKYVKYGDYNGQLHNSTNEEFGVDELLGSASLER